jgi:hypothetical protein
MHARAHSENLLYELAQTLAAGNDHSTAIALRKLVQAGYSTLEQVDGIPDWVLLCVPGIGVKRLGAIRRLTRPDWQPPSQQAMQVAKWYLSAVHLALRFWPPDILASLIRGSAPPVATQLPAEKRLALDVFDQATHKALLYCKAGELIQTLQQVATDHDRSAGNCQVQEFPTKASSLEAPQPGIPTVDQSAMQPNASDEIKDTDRFAHPRHRRLEIVRDYWAARERGQIQNKDSWARSRYHISGKTLLSYEREFQDQRPSATVS